ncbi:hypothetical protein SSCG_05124 [Streptomyces clavuligerus]|nr:hypothetical protein SSCG_05124 [Streptomyces clavuligerus]
MHRVLLSRSAPSRSVRRRATGVLRPVGAGAPSAFLCAGPSAIGVASPTAAHGANMAPLLRHHKRKMAPP